MFLKLLVWLFLRDFQLGLVLPRYVCTFLTLGSLSSSSSSIARFGAKAAIFAWYMMFSGRQSPASWQSGLSFSGQGPVGHLVRLPVQGLVARVVGGDAFIQYLEELLADIGGDRSAEGRIEPTNVPFSPSPPLLLLLGLLSPKFQNLFSQFLRFPKFPNFKTKFPNVLQNLVAAWFLPNFYRFFLQKLSSKFPNFTKIS